MAVGTRVGAGVNVGIGAEVSVEGGLVGTGLERELVGAQAVKSKTKNVKNRKMCCLVGRMGKV